MGPIRSILYYEHLPCLALPCLFEVLHLSSALSYYCSFNISPLSSSSSTSPFLPLSLSPSFPNLLVLTPQSLSLFLIQILLHLFYPCFDCPSSLVLTSRASRYSSLIFNFFFSPDVRLLLSVGSEKLKMYPSTKFGGRVLF
uniref:Uncharacterized protein n=1 Tax=Cacopsylla melanoneura TaxID=428564 RepID=A0A8D8ZBC2_9HEMI